ncbi:MAG: hypothetical protein K2G55_07070 [Lachnospiraceae bacterium]|nr:hypothetical protein [Lachnospiraceae bacterium]
MGKREKGRCIFYVFCLTLAALSFYNMIIGIGDETIFSGFRIARNRNVAAYVMIAVLSIAVGILFVVQMSKHKKDSYMKYASAYTFIVFLFEFIIIGKIDSMICFSSIIASDIVSIIPFFLEKKGIITQDVEFEWKDWKKLTPFTFWFLMAGISIPIELYMNNLGDFQFMFWHYLTVLILCSVVTLGCIYLFSVFLLNERQVNFITTLIFAFAVMAYIQQMFMNRGLNILNGDRQVWDQQTSVINTLIWVVGIAVIFLLRYKRKKIEKLYFTLSIYICLIQIVSSAFLILTGDTNNEAAFKTFTREGSLELNEKNNIIVFVLDRCDASYVYEIEEEIPDFFSPLSDFTFYPNNTCEFANTLNAVPYMLTGTKLNGVKISDYPKYAYENSDFLQVVYDSGYNIAMYTDEDYVEEPFRKNILNYDDDIKQKCRVIDTYYQLMTCSKYRVAPITMKNMYKYGGRDIDNLINESGTWIINNDYPYYCALVENGLTISDQYKGDGTFYFYHFYGSHGGDWSSDMKPVKTDSVSETEQTKAAFKMLYEYIRQMKQLDKYNDATIIITADHGKQLSSDYYLENGIVDRTTIPVLLSV